MLSQHCVNVKWLNARSNVRLCKKSSGIAVVRLTWMMKNACIGISSVDSMKNAVELVTLVNRGVVILLLCEVVHLLVSLCSTTEDVSKVLTIVMSLHATQQFILRKKSFKLVKELSRIPNAH